MTLDAIFMPRPQPVEGRRVAPLGEWPEATAKIKRAERTKRYHDLHRAERIAYSRAYRARKAT